MARFSRFTLCLALVVVALAGAIRPVQAMRAGQEPVRSAPTSRASQTALDSVRASGARQAEAGSASASWMSHGTTRPALASSTAQAVIAAARGSHQGEASAPGHTLVLAVPQSATSRASYTVRLYRRDPFDARRAARPLYRPFTVADGALAVPGLDLSADGRFLAYNDGRYRVDLVDLRTSADRVLGAGMAPRFSPDGRYLAYVAVPGQPLPGLGPHGDGVMLYNVRAATLQRIAQPRGTLLSSVTWSPRGDRLAWQIEASRPAAPFTIGVVDAAQPSRPRTIVPSAPMPVSGGVAWGADGNGLLFWGLASMGGAAHQKLPRFALLGQPLSGGPVRVVLPPMPANWIEGIPPAPALSPDGRLIASLLGTQDGRNQLALFPRDGSAPRHVALLGEPRVVAFAPTGPRAAVVWNAYRDGNDVRRATLVNTATGQVQDFGPAVAAFWQ